MKKLSAVFSLLLCAGVCAFSACSKSGGKKSESESAFMTVYKTYMTYAKENNVTPLSYDEWLAQIKGEKGDTGAQGPQGEKGETGVGVQTAVINEDGDLIITLTDGSVINAGTVKNDENPQELDFYQFDDGTYEVKVGKAALLSNVVIPATYKGKAVTSIGDNAFSDCNKLTNVTIPDSITSLGNRAFSNCGNLKYNEYDNAYYLGNDNNPYLVLIKAKSTDTTYCKIHNNTKFIHSDAFRSCSGLTSITIPDSVTSIGDSAFWYCSGLTSIIIPDGVTSIGYQAFYGCSGLTSITIPNSVTSIGESAFSGCSGLTSITIPDSVTSIGYYAFSGCSGLTSITIPDGVTSIGNSAFNNCRGLTSITIPNSVTSIGESAFEGCRGLTSITIPNGVTSIGGLAFSRCSSLTSITIPNSVTSIGYQAFYNCSGLTSVTIGNGVTSIGDWAFDGCSNLTSITYKGTKKQWQAISKGTNWKNSVPTSCKVYCTDGELAV